MLCICSYCTSEKLLSHQKLAIDKSMNIIRKIHFPKIVSALLLATVLLVTTACNSGNELGARPSNTPVQVGGQNNPHKAGGDGMSKYKVTNDPRVTGKDNAILPSSSTLLAAANQSKTSYPTDDNQVESLLYSDSDEVRSLNNVDDFVSPETQKALKDPAQIPAVKQPIIDRSDPNNQLLEKTAQMFKDAGNFSN